jgi:hypothetical protein
MMRSTLSANSTFLLLFVVIEVNTHVSGGGVTALLLNAAATSSTLTAVSRLGSSPKLW